MANRRSIDEKIEKLKQMASLGFAESEQLLGGDRRHKWSIPDRKIAMKYLIAVKEGMDPRQWGTASSRRLETAGRDRAPEAR